MAAPAIRCEVCGDSGVVQETRRYMVPSGVAYEYTGILQREVVVERTCLGCAGRYANDDEEQS